MFFNEEDEKEHKVLSVSQTSLLVEHRVGGIDFSDLPCLASGRNSNLTSNDMVDLWCQGIDVDGANKPDPKNITNYVPQQGNYYNWKE